MTYVDYEFYKETYHGTLANDTFLSLVNKAQKKVDYYTFGRINKYTIDDNVKYCICEVIDKVSEYDPLVISETNDGFSQTYASNSDFYKEIQKIVSMYLPNLCYRGFYDM